MLSTLAGIFKRGQREDLLPSASHVLNLILATQFPAYELSVIKKPLIKLIQRIGKAFDFPFCNFSLRKPVSLVSRSSIPEASSCYLEISARQPISCC